MDEDTDFIEIEDSDTDLIELAPAPKRLKRLSSEKPKKSSSSSSNSRRKRSKPVDSDLDGAEVVLKPPVKSKRGAKSKKIEVHDSTAMYVDTPGPMESHDDVDFEDVQWEDVEGEGGGELETVLNPVSVPSAPEKHELDIEMAVYKEDDEESKAKNPKKRKRESTGPTKRRGTLKERSYALNYHNMHLLCWLAHAVHLRNQSETNTFIQAVLVSLLPFELFQEITTAVSSSKLFLEAVLSLLSWFHISFNVVHPLTAPKREPIGAPTIDLTIEDEDENASTTKPKKRKNIIEKDNIASDSSAYIGQVHRRLGTFLFASSSRPIVVSQHLAFRIFTTLLEALEIPYRPVWYLDRLVVPSKFSELSLVLPNTAFSLHNWTCMINNALRETIGDVIAIKEDEKAKEMQPKLKHDLPRAAPFIWVEIFSCESDRWIPLDMFRKRVDWPEGWNVALEEDDREVKAPKVKFGASECGYIVAIGAHGKMSFVSPRYVKSYSEPTMKLGDADWFLSLLSEWNTSLPPSSKNVDNRLEFMMEESERKEMVDIAAREGFPKTLEAYKHHPLYVLERHMLKFQALRPNHSPPVHKQGEYDVYLRKDVSLIHTADKWIQGGMQVKDGEKPVSKMIKRTYANWDTVKKAWLDESEAEMSEYFGDWQVEPFVPPVARNGIVPKNRYGNVYLFKLEMLPIGCVHLQGYPHMDKSCRKIGVDVAPAMVGWTIEGYWSIPELDGWVICEDKVEMAIDAWHADTAKREADQLKKIRDRAAQHWLNLTKQLLLKARMDSLHKAKEEAQKHHEKTTTTKTIEHGEEGEQHEEHLLPHQHQPHQERKREAQHTHVFPASLSTTDENGKVTRECPCGYVDSVQRL